MPEIAQVTNVPKVAAVSLSPAHGFSKQSQPHIRLLAGEGVEGDAHRGATVQHLYQERRTPFAPNLAQVHLLGAETLAELHAKGFAVAPGELGENILVEGLDLLALPQGTLLNLGTEAVVEMTGLRTPCRKIDAFRAGLQRHLWGERDATGKRTRRAGVMAIVGKAGLVAAGDRIHVELPPKPWQPLRPV